MLIYDFEVFKYYWLVVFKNLLTNEITVIRNNESELREFYELNKQNIFIGFNNTNYDDFIFKGILLGKSPYHINNMILNKSNISWFAKWNEYPMYSYDVSYSVGFTGLKENEGFMGLAIDECSVPFNLNREPTPEEEDEIEEYCIHDVNATHELFLRKLADYQSKLKLVSMFDLSKHDIKKPTTILIGEILGSQRLSPSVYSDELEPFDRSILPNLQIKNKYVIDYFFNKNVNYKVGLQTSVCGVTHNFGFGGLHGAIPNFSYTGRMIMIDAESYYPSLMIVFNLFSRAIPKENREEYESMKRERVHLKKTDKAKSDVFKLILNMTYGCMKWKASAMYDPRRANDVCVSGQVLLVDLLEKLEPYIKLVQTNTDGILVIPLNEEKVEEICKDWEERHGIKLEFTYANRLYQKDVNNYVLKTDSGDIKVKGGFVSQYDPRTLKRSRAIIDIAVVEYLMNDVPVYKTIGNSKTVTKEDLINYQIISKVGKTYTNGVYIQNLKSGTYDSINYVNRVYPTKDKSYGKLYKQKKGKNMELVASMPNNCLVDNENCKVDVEMIDFGWYIKEAEDRINKFLGE